MAEHADAQVQEQEVLTCTICIEPFNKTIRKRITCLNCNTDICAKCIKRYLAENLQQPNCMQCRWIYTNAFMDTSISKLFRKLALQQIREVVLVEREKQHLPELMHRAKARKEYNELEKRLPKIFTKYYEVQREVSNIKSTISTMALTSNMNVDEIEMLKCSYSIKNIELDNIVKERQQVMKDMEDLKKVYITGGVSAVSQIVQCITPDCKGFLDNDYKCALCNITVCKKCHAEIREGHECDPNNVESVNAIQKETRPCPTCRTPIYKIIGCDQMFCTQCHTAFSWETGLIETGRMHNPHYFAWLREKRQQMPREMGDVPCGGLPSFSKIERKMAELKVSIANTIYIREILKMAVQLQEKEVVKFPVVQGRNNEMDLVNIEYLAEIISEKAWKKKLVDFELVREMNTEQRLLLDMILAVLVDYFNALQHVETSDEVDNILYELDQLREYYNSCIDNLNKRFEVRKFRGIRYDWSKLQV